MTVSLPKKAKLEPRQVSIMAAQESAEEESRVVLEAGQEKLVLMAHELFALAGDDLENAVRAYVSDWSVDSDVEFEVKPVGKPGFRMFGVTPSSLDTNDETVFTQGFFTGHTDGTTQYLAFYLNQEAAKDLEGCRALILQIADTIQIGKLKELERDAGTRNLAPLFDEPRFQITVPHGYVATVQPGPDFVVRRIRKLVPLGRQSPSIVIYCGGHPSFHYLRHPEAENEMEKVEAPLLNTSIEWVRWSVPAKDESTRSYNQEVIIGIGSEPGHPNLFVHISLSSDDTADLEELVQIIGSFKFVLDRQP